ncbi:caspase family protein [Burkholderia sp. Ax-1719]|nr:caspase family protein [Burkholderia sp. Ax-1719]
MRSSSRLTRPVASFSAWGRRAPRFAALGLMLLASALANAQSAGTTAALPLAAPRVALVIGNALYSGVDRLGSPVADARLVADTLRATGFTVDLETDQTRAQMLDAVDRFGASAKSASIALIYYAGHGFENGGENYLIPVDLPVPVGSVTRSDLARYGVPLRYIRSAANRSAPRALVMFLDTCRTAAVRGATRQTLKSVDAARGELIAFATQPGGSALDTFWLGGKHYEHSPFSYYLSQQLRSGGEILTVLRHTQIMVSAATADTQRPWFNDGLIGELRLADAASPVADRALLPPVLSGVLARGGQASDSDSDTGAMNWSVSRRPPPDNPVTESTRWDSELDQMLKWLPLIWTDTNFANKVHAQAEGGDLFAQTAIATATHMRMPGEPDPVWYMSHALSIEYAVYAAGRHYPLAEALYGNFILDDSDSPERLYTASLFLRRAVDDGYARALDRLIPLLAQINDADGVARYQALYHQIYGRKFELTDVAH